MHEQKIVKQRTTVIVWEDLLALHRRVRTRRGPCTALRVGLHGLASGLSVSRGRSATPERLDLRKAVLLQEQEGPMQSGAIGLVAERPADIVAIEDIRNLGERRLDLCLELPDSPPARLRRRRGRSGGWSGGRLRLGTGSRLRRRKREGYGLLRGGHPPHQIQGPDLVPMSRLEQLDAGAELLIESPFAFVVFFSRHVRERIASQKAERRKVREAWMG